MVYIEIIIRKFTFISLIISRLNQYNSWFYDFNCPTGLLLFFYDIEVETPCNIPVTPSWDCDGQGNCYDPGTGNGQYILSSCQSNCIIPLVGIVMVRVTVMILEQETDSIHHFKSVKLVCVPSWDCDGQGNCYDPGTGNGQYFIFKFMSN